MDSSKQIEVLNRARLNWNQGKLASYLELYSPNAVLHGYPGVESGLESIRRFYEGFWTAFPESQLVFEDIFSAGEKVVCRFAVHGKHLGNFQGMPPTGRTFSLPGITILRIQEGKCVERWSQADFLGLLQQLGAIASG